MTWNWLRMTSTSPVCEVRSGETIDPDPRTPILKLVEKTGRIAGKSHDELAPFD